MNRRSAVASRRSVNQQSRIQFAWAGENQNYRDRSDAIMDPVDVRFAELIALEYWDVVETESDYITEEEVLELRRARRAELTSEIQVLFAQKTMSVKFD